MRGGEKRRKRKDGTPLLVWKKGGKETLLKDKPKNYPKG